MDGYGRKKAIGEYLNAKPRKVSELIQQGLPYYKIPGGSILIKYSDVDEFLNKFKHTEHEVDATVKEIMKGLK
jgi:excisionase family DNA binding protein